MRVLLPCTQERRPTVVAAYQPTGSASVATLASACSVASAPRSVRLVLFVGASRSLPPWRSFLPRSVAGLCRLPITTGYGGGASRVGRLGRTPPASCCCPARAAPWRGGCSRRGATVGPPPPDCTAGQARRSSMAQGRSTTWKKKM